MILIKAHSWCYTNIISGFVHQKREIVLHMSHYQIKILALIGCG